MRQREDDEQLAFASSLGRVLYSYNVGDYLRVHSDWLTKGRSHSGIVLARQQTSSIGEELRCLLRLIAVTPAEEMENRISFLSDWGDDS